MESREATALVGEGGLEAHQHRLAHEQKVAFHAKGDELLARLRSKREVACSAQRDDRCGSTSKGLVEGAVAHAPEELFVLERLGVAGQELNVREARGKAALHPREHQTTGVHPETWLCGKPQQRFASEPGERAELGERSGWRRGRRA